jgi:leucyl aminopeptidase (aminopeptidase T)
MSTQLGVCNLCEAICGLELTIEEGRVTSIRGSEADPLSRGYIWHPSVSRHLGEWGLLCVKTPWGVGA